VSAPSPFPYPIERGADVEPPAEFAQLREACPVAPVRMPTGDIAYLVTRYDDVRRVLSAPAFSTNRSRPGAPRPVAMSRDDSMLNMDGRDHARLRGLISRAFTPRRVELLRGRVQQVIDDLLDELAAAGPPADANLALARPLPMTVLAELLGVPFVDRAKLHVLTEGMTSLTAHPPAEMAAARAAMREYAAELIAVKRVSPADDLLSAMITARDEHDGLSESELVSQTVLLLVAGYETTMNQIGNSVVALLRDPDCAAHLRADSALIGPAVEELLRHDPPGDTGQYRVTVEDVELAGTRIPANSAVLAVIPAANRDEQHFEDSDRLLLTRDGEPHLSFGHGPHYCLGATLVRMEMQLLFTSLLQRFPGLRLAVPLEALRWRRGYRLGGYREVPIAW
jgi:cytochrome P450